MVSASVHFSNKLSSFILEEIILYVVVFVELTSLS